MAFVAAFGGAAATSAPTDAVGWAGCLGAGLVAFGAVFATPNKVNQPPPVDVAITAIHESVQQANLAVSDVERIRAATHEVFGAQRVPVLGPLAQQVIDTSRPGR
jgi:hypothetical protein